LIDTKIGDLEWRNGPYFALFHWIFTHIIRPTSTSKSTFNSRWPY